MKYLNLSSKAKAIVDAYSEANDCYDEECGQIAAALRTVVEQLAYYDDYGNWYIDPRYILEIAEELEKGQ